MKGISPQYTDRLVMRLRIDVVGENPVRCIGGYLPPLDLPPSDNWPPPPPRGTVFDPEPSDGRHGF